ncbi:hypothetical protein P171DRAFT_86149 [Karstenula rhodostoma CBS 690.94]|uniref:Uncharacterized protein n=1 Tax=Karstenula rhodostoma CBS 690.94 TaxID=1392251 RepID=A0A9P4U798_9PLEO|nr:hypothetical protein P171DRAFT_86149 [Karstenula rhodostoma CBS 690.94]
MALLRSHGIRTGSRPRQVDGAPTPARQQTHDLGITTRRLCCIAGCSWWATRWDQHTYTEQQGIAFRILLKAVPIGMSIDLTPGGNARFREADVPGRSLGRGWSRRQYVGSIREYPRACRVRRVGSMAVSGDKESQRRMAQWRIAMAAMGMHTANFGNLVSA